MRNPVEKLAVCVLLHLDFSNRCSKGTPFFDKVAEAEKLRP